ncbi:MAG TPA: hypothetical protein VGX03_31615 [Candidatus Binatia bacterium]|nr:hypothetical protein [Candidatus Binatia bacterium]
MRHSPNRSVLISVLFILVPLWAAFTLTPSWAQSLKKRTILTVVDARGKKVGKVFGVTGSFLVRRFFGVVPAPSGVLVAFQVKGHPPFMVGVVADRFIGNSPVVFASTDCSGTPFLPDSTPILVGADLSSDAVGTGDALLPPVAVASPGQTVYLPDPVAPSQRIVEGSLLINGTCSPVSGSSPTDVHPALALIDLERVFTPPFRLR